MTDPDRTLPAVRPRLLTRTSPPHRSPHEGDDEDRPLPQSAKPLLWPCGLHAGSCEMQARRAPAFIACVCGVVLSFMMLTFRHLLGHDRQAESLGDGPCKCRGPGAPTVPLVVSWVNVSDPKWQAQAKRHGCDVDQYLSGEGDVDPFDSLRYLLRSVAMYAPFLSPIIITTERDQVPSWLNTSRADVRVVFHDEYVPAAPVFNSQPFEYRFSHFPNFNLTTGDGRPTNSSLFGSCFVYMNDDFLLNGPLSPSHLVDDRGRIMSYLVEHVVFYQRGSFHIGLDLPVGFWPMSLRQEGARGPNVEDPHTPYVMSRPLIRQAIAEGCPGNSSRLAMASRCTREGPPFMRMFSMFLGRHAKRLLNPRPWWWLLVPLVRHLPIGASGLNIDFNLFLANLLAFWRPLFLFLFFPSHDNIEADAYKVQHIKDFLETRFPHPSPWESSAPR
eukprot:GGOE01032314.1.p1 GENE.GGOE01032314.1~~GGOE01032314.1.p1  ORF type:complete len:443 (+),score=65.57 GGOE01032314.1:61-1389(+)